MKQHWILLIVLCAYFVALLGIVLGSRIKRTGSALPDAHEFFLAGKDLSTPVLVATFIGSLFSAFTVVGIPSSVYAHGISDFFWMAGVVVLLPLIMWLSAKQFYRLSRSVDSLSPVETVSKIIKNKPLGLLMGAIILVYLIPYLSIQLIGIGKLLESVSGGDIGYLDGVGFIMGTIILYLIFGGMRAVAYTDFVQAILIFIGIVGTVTFFIYYQFGGLMEMWHALETQRPDQLNMIDPDGKNTIPMIISTILFISLLVVSQPQTLTRYMMARNEKQITVMIWVTFICTAVGWFGSGLLGLSGSIIYPNLAEANLLPGQVMGWMLDYNGLTLILGGMLLIGVIAASMSTADSLLIAIGQIFVRDVLNPYVHFSRKIQVILAKILMVIFLGIAFWFGLNPPPVMIDLASYSFMGTAILAPVFIGFCFPLWRHLICAYAGIIGGQIIFISLMISGINYLGFHPAFWGLATSVAFVMLGRYLNKNNRYIP